MTRPFWLANFNPLPSYEGRLNSNTRDVIDNQFQSTPLIRGETPFRRAIHPIISISIRSPHTRGDASPAPAAPAAPDFNPLPSHEGRRLDIMMRQGPQDFNPLPSHEGRLFGSFSGILGQNFNPLPSHEGRHKRPGELVCTANAFQSAPLTRGETGAAGQRQSNRKISIRSPHTRGDDAGLHIPSLYA